ncbi:unnamed protein product [Diamesa serratosioi]
MNLLDREKFTKIVKVPVIKYDVKTVLFLKDLIVILKKYFLKIDKFKPVVDGSIYLSPNLIQEFTELPISELSRHGIKEEAFVFEELTLKYENWKSDDIIRAILPDGLEPATSFSRVGHIIHLNLKDNLLPYKTIIGEILLDKVVGCRTVVNKASSIDNTYRNFQIDLLCGDPEYQVLTKENGTSYEFDFSTVYWNPRLSTEHERLVKKLNSNDYFYDVFAGVGPFSVPAGKKRVNTLANDLNPNSFKWLEHNVKKNKVSKYVQTFMKDGREFILSNIKENLLERIKNRDEDSKEYSIHIAMNLPALAVTFVDAFIGLLRNNNLNIEDSNSIPTPIVHVYCFVRGDDVKQLARDLVEENMGMKLIENDTLKEIVFVRNVAPNKDMMRVSINLTNDILFSANTNKRSASISDDLTTSKKQCKKGKSQGERARGKEQKPELSTAKKVGKLFKVATTNNKIAQKKTKEIPKKLKNMNILKKQDKCDADLKDLHLKMVTKKDIKPKMKPIGKKSKAVATTDVEDSLNSMNF